MSALHSRPAWDMPRCYCFFAHITGCQQQGCGPYWVCAGTVVNGLLTFAAPCHVIEQSSARTAVFQSDRNNAQRVERCSASLSFEVECKYWIHVDVAIRNYRDLKSGAITGPNDMGSSNSKARQDPRLGCRKAIGPPPCRNRGSSL